MNLTTEEETMIRLVAEEESRKRLAAEEETRKYWILLAAELDTRVVISNLGRVNTDFDLLKSNFVDLFQSSFEIVINNSNDENNILHKILKAINLFLENIKGMNVPIGSNVSLKTTQECFNTMVRSIMEAMERNSALYEGERRQKLIDLQTSILRRYEDLSNILETQLVGYQSIQSTINKIFEQSEIIHGELIKVRNELSKMNHKLTEFAVTTKRIVASNVELEMSIDFLENRVNRMCVSNLNKYTRLIKYIRSTRVLLNDFKDHSGLQDSLAVSNFLLLTLLRETYDIPTITVLLPVVKKGKKSFLKNPMNHFTNKYRLFFVCSHSFKIAPCGPKGMGFKITTTKECLKKAAPVLTVGLVLVKLALAANSNPFPVTDLLNGLRKSSQSEYFTAALKALEYRASTLTKSAMKAIGNKPTDEELLARFILDKDGTREAYDGIKEMLKVYPNFGSSCGLEFVHHGGKVAWVLKDQVEEWKNSF